MDYSSGFLTRRERIQRRKRASRLVLLVFVFFCAGIFFITLKSNVNSTSSFSEAIHRTPTPTVIPTPTSIPNSSPLENVVQNALLGTHGSYGIVVQNLKTGEYFGFNEHQVFKSGSLYKLWVMAVVYQQIQQRKINLSDTLSKDLEDLSQEFNVQIDPTESQTSGVLTMTVQNALYQMITISDNNAALLLTDKVGISSLTNFLQSNGLTESKVETDGDDPTTSASNVAMFFYKLYHGQLADQEQTTNMINLLKEQRLNEKIPLNLPDGTAVAHKTGEIDDFSHDAGIIYGPSSDYILAVLTESDDTNAAIARIASVSEAVYNYFETDPSHTE